MLPLAMGGGAFLCPMLFVCHEITLLAMKSTRFAEWGYLVLAGTGKFEWFLDLPHYWVVICELELPVW